MGTVFRDQILSFCKTVLSAQPNFKTQNTSLTTILALVGAGAGVTLVPAISLSGSWVTDSGIALRREKTGSAFSVRHIGFSQVVSKKSTAR